MLPDSEWRRRLTPEQYRILRGSGTETCFTGPYHDHKGRTGVFVCAGCELPLFAGAAKFDSGTGWPSFFQPVHPRNVGRKLDLSYGMVRIEVFCNRCDGHLGHVFEDGPPPTGLRYCINGHAIKLIDEPSAAGR
ncbi:MAG: peptide-methionine (R)-S-oxide reductase MsrB [Tepidisphaerales bacterium]